MKYAGHKENISIAPFTTVHTLWLLIQMNWLVIALVTGTVNFNAWATIYTKTRAINTTLKWIKAQKGNNYTHNIMSTLI